MDAWCLRCGQSMAQTVAVCGECLKHTPTFDKVLAAYHYQKPVDHLIHAIKRGRNLTIMKALLPELVLKLRSEYGEGDYPEALVPVPMHWLRSLERGFNHAHYLAAMVSKVLPATLPVLDPIKRTSLASPQKTLSRAGRRKNVQNILSLKKPILAKHVAIIDDVVTTGATCEAMASLLKAHSVERVDVWSLARA